MSKLLEENIHFLYLLLNPPVKIQAEALLDTASNSQIKSLSEIARNLLLLPLNEKGSTVVKKREKLLLKLADKKLSNRVKGRLLSRHRRIILDILSHVKTPLYHMLKELEHHQGAKDLSENKDKVDQDEESDSASL